ncbi:Dyp-type peroxidase [Parasalinivibrio latis]|uniref:Dyp-type peroxidase n=1 Tax=Parasalinivibrio latis TaxID=2952610 RepID=UPI0030E20155
MATPQSGILPEAGPFALYTLFKVTGDKRVVCEHLKALHSLVEEVNASQPGADLCAAVSFTPSFWKEIGGEMPSDFEVFKPLGSGKVQAPATESDFLVHIHSLRLDLNFYLLRKFMSGVSRDVEVLDETYGYRYLDSRDMTGFVDGTENPKTDEDRRNIAIIADGKCAGGSFVMTQRFIHKLAAWERLGVEKQEKIIGRTKPDSVELEDVPATSHVGRVDIKENGKGLKILRHSLPYGSVSGDHGLLFIAYCNNQHNFREMLASMYGERDGSTDAMLMFTEAVTGAYLYAPSMEQLSAI